MLKENLSRSNVLISLFSFLLILLSNLILRSYLLNSVGSDYFAVNVILTNTVNAFSIFELGVGVTVVFLFYKPVVENDRTKVSSLYFYFKRIYVYISVLTLAVSMPLVFLIYNFVSDVIGFYDFSFLYFFFLSFSWNDTLSAHSTLFFKQPSYFALYGACLVITIQKWAYI